MSLINIGIIVVGFICFIIILGAIYYYNFGERGNLKKYISCMCKKYKENKAINEQEEGKECFNKLKEDVSHGLFRTRSKDRYPDLWKKLEECKQ